MGYGYGVSDARGYVNARAARESAPRWYADTFRESSGPFPTQSAAAVWVSEHCAYAGPIVTLRGPVHVGRDGTVYCGRGSSRLTLGRVYRAPRSA